MDIRNLYKNLDIFGIRYHIVFFVSILGFLGIIVNYPYKSFQIIFFGSVLCGMIGCLCFAIHQIISFFDAIINPGTITISLKPQTKFYPIAQTTSKTFVLPHQTNVIIRNGFTFKLISSNIVYELGPIEFRKNNCDIYKINPKSITLKEGTPFVQYGSIKYLSKPYDDEYYCLAMGTQITLPQGTIFNDGVDLIKLKSDTLVTVA